MRINLKKSEKILLAIFIASIILFIFLLYIQPKIKSISSLNTTITQLENEIEGLEQTSKIEATDNSVTKEEKELDNKLLTYKNDYNMENFSQDYIIVKINDFLGENSSAIDGFMIRRIDFKKGDSEDSDIFNKIYLGEEYYSNDALVSQADYSNEQDINLNNIENLENLDNIVNLENSQELENIKNSVPVEDFNDDNIKDGFNYYSVTIDFVSNYEGLQNYIKNIENFSKSIIVNSVQLSPVIQNKTVSAVEEENVSTNGMSYVGSDGYLKAVPDYLLIENGSINGTMELLFVDFSIFDNDNIEYRNPFFDQYTEYGLVENPFKPYSNFTKYEEPVEEDNSDNNYNNNYDVPTGALNTYKTIYDFEDDKYFFVSSPTNISGAAQSSPLAYSGSYSGKLSYNFSKGIETNTASYVFNTNNILITEQPNSVALKVYKLTDMPYSLGITIKDSAGKTYDVVLGENYNNTSLWTTYEGMLPELTYPCIVKRVFVTTDGVEKTQLQGELLLDKLEVSRTNY